MWARIDAILIIMDEGLVWFLMEERLTLYTGGSSVLAQSLMRRASLVKVYLGGMVTCLAQGMVQGMVTDTREP